MSILIAERGGNDLPDEKILEIARAVKMRPSLLLKNYKWTARLNKILPRPKKAAVMETRS